MAKRLVVCVAIVACLIGTVARADTGVLTPFFGSREAPAESLSFDTLHIRLRLDAGQARVEMLHVYRSHASRPLEGDFRMIVPESADIDGFAIWDDLVRIPGVIMEKAQARRIFDEITRASADPGLLAGEDEPTVVNEFTARVVPIPPYGAKRLEMSYRTPAPLERGRLDFTLPLRPDDGRVQRIAHVVIEIVHADDLPIVGLTFHGATLVPEVTERTERGFTARYAADDVAIDEDLSFTVEYRLPETTVEFATYRDVEHADWLIGPGGGHFQDEYGYFLARILFAPEQSAAVGRRHVLLVVDGSLSMLGDKLQRAAELVRGLTAALAPTDRITLLFANTQTLAAAGDWQPATPEWRAGLDAFLRNQAMAGGLDLTAALDRAAAMIPDGGDSFVILLGDGHPTAGLLRYDQIVAAVRRSPLATKGARLFAVGIGDDANRTLLAELAAAVDGHYAWCADTADGDAIAQAVAARLAAAMMREITLSLDDPGNVVDAYPPALPATFAGGETALIGRYRRPGPARATLSYRGQDGARHESSYEVTLPERATDREGIRRRWAKARVDYLLDRIRREGEKQEWIDEIVALSKRFTFVTPYTAFLAAPRALLRPRVIRPGDPLLRVRTTAEVRAVTAIFPWGLTVPLTYLADEDIWQVRFLAPPGFPDGTYECRLLLIDRAGGQVVETKSFVLDGRAPTVRPAMALRLAAGGKARVAVYADGDTRRLVARLPFAPPADLRWNDAAKASVGLLDVPAGAPLGPARLEVYAEDFAHNVSRTVIDVEVVDGD